MFLLNVLKKRFGGSSKYPPMSTIYTKDLSEQEAADKTILLYATRVDPWNLAREKERFSLTNDIIKKRFHRVGRLLEIGAGEGFQTEWLCKVADQVTGIDLSPIALERARKRVPKANFLVSSLPHLPLSDDSLKFDVAVACEVLYFTDDIPLAISRMRQLAPNGLVTGLEKKWKRFGKALSNIKSLEVSRISTNNIQWLVATWKD